MAVWGSLTNSCEKKRSKSKREKERYTHLNAEFQRIARRDKKVFLGNQCKEIKENNRMEKTRDLFKKIRDTKGTFHASEVKSLSRVRLFATLCTVAYRLFHPWDFPGKNTGVGCQSLLHISCKDGHNKGRK